MAAPRISIEDTYMENRNLYVMWMFNDWGVNWTGFRVEYSKDGAVVCTDYIDKHADHDNQRSVYESSYHATSGEWSIDIVASHIVDGVEYDDSLHATTTVTLDESWNPTELQGSITDGGIASITWTPSEDDSVIGYAIYMLAPQRVLVGYAPYGKPEFKFAFENPSLTEKLIEMSSYLENAFLYQLEKRTQYAFAVVSYTEEVENTPEDGPIISMYYDTHPIFESMSLKPNPAFTQETLLISAGISEQIDSIITTS